MQALLKKYQEISKLFCVTSPTGYSEKKLEEVEGKVGKIPEALRLFYKKYGNTKKLCYMQDQLVLPDDFLGLIDDAYLIFFDENQGVCRAGIKKTDAELFDPPVYVSMVEEEWKLAQDKVSDFLVAMYGYEASIVLDYNPEEFYFVKKEEIEIIEQRFTKRPERIKGWLDCEIVLYGNENGRIALMIQDDLDIQMNYAANSKEEFERMQKLLSGIGEVI